MAVSIVFLLGIIGLLVLVAGGILLVWFISRSNANERAKKQDKDMDWLK